MYTEVYIYDHPVGKWKWVRLTQQTEQQKIQDMGLMSLQFWISEAAFWNNKNPSYGLGLTNHIVSKWSIFILTVLLFTC